METPVNPFVLDARHPDFMVNNKPGRLTKRDDYTVVFEFPEPNYLFVDILAGSTAMGGGQATQQHNGRTMGAYMPAHYLKQFHPKYTAKDDLDKKAKAMGFDGWVSLIKNRWDWRLNPELPVVGPWKTVTHINTQTWTMERNPYYYGIDSEGNQLPYIDKISMALAENLEVLNLRAIAGGYDQRHTALSKLPVFLENRGKGNYDVRLDTALNGSDATLQINNTYEADPEIAKWLHTREFRRALSLGIDRDLFRGLPGGFILRLRIRRGDLCAQGLDVSVEPAEVGDEASVQQPVRLGHPPRTILFRGLPTASMSCSGRSWSYR